MKIEFRKVSNSKKELFFKYNSVTIDGTFYKISPSLVKIEACLKGNTSVNCNRCNKQILLQLNEEFYFLLSDGIYKNESDESIIEIENGLINFEELVESELNSIKSDYYTCEECLQNSNEFEREY